MEGELDNDKQTDVKELNKENDLVEIKKTRPSETEVRNGIQENEKYQGGNEAEKGQFLVSAIVPGIKACVLKRSIKEKKPPSIVLRPSVQSPSKLMSRSEDCKITNPSVLQEKPQNNSHSIPFVNREVPVMNNSVNDKCKSVKNLPGVKLAMKAGEGNMKKRKKKEREKKEKNSAL